MNIRNELFIDYEEDRFVRNRILKYRVLSYIIAGFASTCLPGQMEEN